MADPLVTSDNILNSYGGRVMNDLNEIILGNDQQNYETDISISSQYVTLSQLPAAVQEYSNGFSVLSLNCQSINAKFDVIKTILEELRNSKFEFSAICLQESWLSGNPPDTSLFHLPGYQTFALGATCSSHGGLLTYISERYNVTHRDLYTTSKLWEGLFLKISRDGMKPLTLGNIYRPPRRNNNNEVVQSFIAEFGPVIEKLH